MSKAKFSDELFLKLVYHLQSKILRWVISETCLSLDLILLIRDKNMWNYLTEKPIVIYKHYGYKVAKHFCMAEPLLNHKQVRNHDPCIVFILLTLILRLQNDLLGPFKSVGRSIYHFTAF